MIIIGQKDNQENDAITIISSHIISLIVIAIVIMISVIRIVIINSVIFIVILISVTAMTFVIFLLVIIITNANETCVKQIDKNWSAIHNS